MQRAAEANDRSDGVGSVIRNHESGLAQREANGRKRNRDNRPQEETYGFDEEENKLTTPSDDLAQVSAETCVQLDE